MYALLLPILNLSSLIKHNQSPCLKLKTQYPQPVLKRLPGLNKMAAQRHQFFKAIKYVVITHLELSPTASERMQAF